MLGIACLLGVTVVPVGAGAWMLWKPWENDDRGFRMSLGGILVGTGLVMFIIIGYIATHPPGEAKPCVRWDTSAQYNPATKTVMPMRYCAQYGEWVAPSDG